MGFADSIRKNSTKQLREVDNKITDMAVELFDTVVFCSPHQPLAKYAKGEFINNWVAVANGESSQTISAKSMTGEDSLRSIERFKGMSTFLGTDGYVTLSNNVSYAYLVEYAGWPQSINPRWINNVGPYAPVRNAWTIVVPKYKK